MPSHAPNAPLYTPRWGRMLKRFCDEGRTLHLLREDGGPRCGARFYASAGQSLDESGPKCRTCERIAQRPACRFCGAPLRADGGCTSASGGR